MRALIIKDPWASQIVSGKKTLDIMTGKDILSITKLQLPGKKMISVKDFLNGYANLIED